ncbi:Ankyrin repeat and SOCS box protein 10 [Kappamyces sp. JEL0680]|nr:Ankyrin repeat and SOCS box protein 10 [Kappamyces sp. JEL0680]
MQTWGADAPGRSDLLIEFVLAAILRNARHEVFLWAAHSLAKPSTPLSLDAAIDSHTLQTSLMKASMAGHENIVKVLLHFGATTDKTDLYGNDAILLSKSVPVMTMLLGHPRSPQSSTNRVGKTSLMHAVSLNSLTLVKLVLSRLAAPCSASCMECSRCIVNAATTENGDTALHMALELPNPSIVATLLQAGACASQQRSDGTNSAHQAMQTENLACLEHLLASTHCSCPGCTAKHFLDQACQQGMTPLHLAAKRQNMDLVQRLLEYPVNVNATTTASGSTPLILASMAGHLHICRLLIRAGAARSTKDSKGLLPIDHAARRPNCSSALLGLLQP